MKFLYQPIKGAKITQGFGENNACTDKSRKKFVSPVNGVCPDGFESLYKNLGLNGHNGLDFHAKMWEPIYASCDGIVEEVNTDIATGLGVGVITDKKYPCTETNLEEHFKYRNWHFQAINVTKGQKVKTGDLLGWAGMTGYATGPHDHFELKPVAQKPSGWWYNILQDNGFKGAVDPAPYLLPLAAIDADKVKKIFETMSKILEKISDMLRAIK